MINCLLCMRRGQRPYSETIINRLVLYSNLEMYELLKNRPKIPSAICFWSILKGSSLKHCFQVLRNAVLLSQGSFKHVVGNHQRGVFPVSLIFVDMAGGASMVILKNSRFFVHIWQPCQCLRNRGRGKST